MIPAKDRLAFKIFGAIVCVGGFIYWSIRPNPDAEYAIVLANIGHDRCSDTQVSLRDFEYALQGDYRTEFRVISREHCITQVIRAAKIAGFLGDGELSKDYGDGYHEEIWIKNATTLEIARDQI